MSDYSLNRVRDAIDERCRAIDLTLALILVVLTFVACDADRIADALDRAYPTHPQPETTDR